MGSPTAASPSALSTSYFYGINLLSRSGSDGRSYYLHNGHGDVTLMTNASGAVVKAYDYDAFGVEKNPAAVDNNPFRYCGEYWDVETDTYYLRARYYSPGMGRFLTEDPIRDGLNWYGYCDGNPVMWVDPSGHYAQVLQPLIPYADQAFEFLFTLALGTLTGMALQEVVAALPAPAPSIAQSKGKAEILQFPTQHQNKGPNKIDDCSLHHHFAIILP